MSGDGVEGMGKHGSGPSTQLRSISIAPQNARNSRAPLPPPSIRQAACSDSMGVGWVSPGRLATWEALAHELGRSLGGIDFIDTKK